MDLDLNDSALPSSPSEGRRSRDGTPTRSSRDSNKITCQSCSDAKRKCSGKTPKCNHCTIRNLDCVYKVDRRKAPVVSGKSSHNLPVAPELRCMRCVHENIDCIPTSRDRCEACEAIDFYCLPNCIFSLAESHETSTLDTLDVASTDVMMHISPPLPRSPVHLDIAMVDSPSPHYEPAPSTSHQFDTGPVNNTASNLQRSTSFTSAPAAQGLAQVTGQDNHLPTIWRPLLPLSYHVRISRDISNHRQDRNEFGLQSSAFGESAVTTTTSRPPQLHRVPTLPTLLPPFNPPSSSSSQPAIVPSTYIHAPQPILPISVNRVALLTDLSLRTPPGVRTPTQADPYSLRHEELPASLIQPRYERADRLDELLDN